MLSPQFANDRGYYGFDYLGNNGAVTSDGLFILLAQERQGFYLGAHDQALREMVNFFFRFRPGHEDSYSEQLPTTDLCDGHQVALELFVAHFSYVNRGESHVLTPVVIQPYAGTWHKGVDCYRQWRATWFTRTRLPEWVTAPHAWQQLQMNCAEDCLRYRYADLVEIGRECAEHGVKAIQLVGWNDGGQDRGNPSHDTDPRLGSWEELRQAIADVQALGVNMILFSKFTWGDRSQPWYRSTGYRHAAKDPYGDAYVYGGYQYQTFEQCADVNTRRFSPMCPLSPAWREVAAGEFAKLLDLGAAGMLYDECQHHTPAQILLRLQPWPSPAGLRLWRRCSVNRPFPAGQRSAESGFPLRRRSVLRCRSPTLPSGLFPHRRRVDSLPAALHRSIPADDGGHHRIRRSQQAE